MGKLPTGYESPLGTGLGTVDVDLRSQIFDIRGSLLGLIEVWSSAVERSCKPPRVVCISYQG